MKTIIELRRLIKSLEEIVHSGRSTITLKSPELKGAQRKLTLTGYRALLETRKRRLLMEKLRRLRAAQS